MEVTASLARVRVSARKARLVVDAFAASGCSKRSKFCDSCRTRPR